MSEIHPWRFVRRLALVAIVGVMPLAAAQAQGGGTTVDEEQLLQRLKEEIMRELRESDFLKKEIEAGIQNYAKKQRAAQVAARAEQARKAAESAKNVRRVSASRDHIFGNPQAKVSLIEYSDFECPFCKRFHPTAKQVIEAYAGRVNWVYRHFPLGFHNPGAQKQAEASECAAELGGNDAFWQYTDAIYARTRSNGKGFALDKLVPLAQELGLDAGAFKDCLDSGKHAGRVTEDLKEGATVGITGTPGNILLNNETGEVRLVSGAAPLARFKAEIDPLLK